MLRGYRLLFAALAGLALAGAGPPNEAKPNGTAAEKVKPTAAPVGNYSPYSDYQSSGCYRDKNHDAADLCAQWRAAVAAEEAADTSYWGNWIASGGALLSFISILLVLRALAQTDESLNAAREANRIAQEGAVLQFRPYMGTLGAAVIGPQSLQPRVVIDIKNFGQTPARIVRQDFRVIHFRRTAPNVPTHKIFYDVPVPPDGLCEPGHTQSRSAIIDGPINVGSGDCVFAELTQTYRSFDSAVYWRRMSYRVDENSSYETQTKIRMDVHEIDTEEGEGNPPPSHLKPN